MGALPPIPADELTIVPANEVPWADVETVLGPEHCYCQRFKASEWIWHVPEEVRRADLVAQTHCEDPTAPATTGLVAYLGDEPVGWVAVQPRPSYPKLTRTVWSGRSEDRTDEGIWAVTCFVTRRGYRNRGVTYALLQAAVGHARDRGARAVEGYPMQSEPGKEVIWGELFVGAWQVFVEAGFAEVTRPSKRRRVMRLELS